MICVRVSLRTYKLAIEPRLISTDPVTSVAIHVRERYTKSNITSQQLSSEILQYGNILRRSLLRCAAS